VIARQIANAHTLFNGLCALVWLPLTGQMVRLSARCCPIKIARKNGCKPERGMVY
jgi:phosphate:Na+ symporter